MNDPSFAEVWTRSATGASDPPRLPIVQRALQDHVEDDDVAELIATWPLCQLFRLQPGDRAVVAGSYKGKVIQALLELYPGIHVDGFEPQRWANEEATQRLKPYQPTIAWTIYPFALGDQTRQNVPMGEFGTDACSFINVGPQAREHGAGDMVDVVDALNVIGGRVDLMVLNCEGYEYRLIRHMITAKLLPSIKRLAIQWHVGLSGNGDLQAEEWDVDQLLNSVGFTADHRLVYDERPTWTYSEARNVG